MEEGEAVARMYCIRVEQMNFLNYSVRVDSSELRLICSELCL